MNPAKKRINGLNAVALVVVAGLFDLVGFGLNALGVIPIIGAVVGWTLAPLVGLTSVIVFGVWFTILGVGFINPKRFATALGGIVVELTPILDASPGITGAVILTIMLVTAEDRVGIHLPIPGGGKK